MMYVETRTTAQEVLTDAVETVKVADAMNTVDTLWSGQR